jgi:pimeloyl-ACP methyl ester carboxylesterase
MSILVELPLALYNARAFDAFAPAADFDLGTARAMAWMSQLAYESKHPDKIAAVCKTWDLRHPRIIASPATALLPIMHTRGIMVEGHGATILAFAGTDPLVPANWFTDLDFKVTPGNVHRGFDAAARSVWDALRDALALRRERPVVLAGHSLGAALAVVTADRMLAELNIRPVAVYAFGMPRAGDDEFARRYNDTLGAATFRLVHGDDVVATVPPSATGFRHVGRLICCRRGGTFGGGAMPASDFGDDPAFAPALASGLRQGLLDLFALRPQPSFRDDLLGRLSGLLPPPIADHLPDRYCHALDAA